MFFERKTIVSSKKTVDFVIFTNNTRHSVPGLFIILSLLSNIHKKTKLGIEIMYPFVYNTLIAVPCTLRALSGGDQPFPKGD
jgi:hypothetical protein